MIRHELVRIMKKFFYHKEKIDELLTDKQSIQIQKSQICDFPNNLTPSSHTHTKSDISDFPSSMTPISHTHQKVDVTDFNHTHQKVDISDFSHTHSKSQISDFPTSMDPTSHTHSKSEISDFPVAMDPTSHSHLKVDISDFSHTHSKSEISDFPVAMDPTSHNHGSLSDTGVLNTDADNVNKVAVTDANNNLKTITKVPFSNLNISKENITSLGIPGTDTMAASDWENMTDSLTNVPSDLRGRTYFYVNKKLRIAVFRFGAEFHSAQSDQYYYYPNNNTAIIPSRYRPKFLVSSGLNQVGSLIVDDNGVVSIVLGVSWNYTGNNVRKVYGTCVWFY